MIIKSVIIWPIFATVFNFLMLQAGDVSEPVKSFSSLTIILVALGLTLAVIIVVGLPFYMNYRTRILPKEESKSQSDTENASSS